MESNEFSRHLIKDGYSECNSDGVLLLKDKSPLPQKVDYSDRAVVELLANKAFYTAEGLFSLIENNCNISDPGASPTQHLELYLALAALTCEIYIKGIVYLENRHNGKQCFGHDLNTLFKLLPEKHIEALRKRIGYIETVLPSVGEAFKKLRYDYELNNIHGEYLILFALMKELKAISENYPKQTINEIRVVGEEFYAPQSFISPQSIDS